MEVRLGPTGSTSLSDCTSEELLSVEKLDRHHGAYQKMSTFTRTNTNRLTKPSLDPLHCLPPRILIPVSCDEFLPQGQAELKRNVGAELGETELRVVGVEEVEKLRVREAEFCCLLFERVGHDGQLMRMEGKRWTRKKEYVQEEGTIG